MRSIAATSHRPCHRPAPARRGQRGIAIVELALVLLPLVLLLAAAAEFGRAFYTYNVLAQGVRGATRYLALVDDPDKPANQQEVRNLVRFGNTDGTGSVLVTGLTEAMVKLCTPSDYAACTADHSSVATGSGTMDLVSVRIVGFSYTPMFSAMLTAPLTFSTIGLTMRTGP
jgi:Flp pilus assembly protein TadG